MYVILRNLHVKYVYVISVCVKYTDVFICGNLHCNAILKIVIKYYRVLTPL